MQCGPLKHTGLFKGLFSESDGEGQKKEIDLPGACQATPQKRPAATMRKKPAATSSKASAKASDAGADDKQQVEVKPASGGEEEVETAAAANQLESAPAPKSKRVLPPCPGRCGYWDPPPGLRLCMKQPTAENYVAPQPCVFNVNSPGQAATFHSSRGHFCCMFCDPAQLQQALSKTHGSQAVTRCLRTFKEKNQAVYEVALARLPQRYRKVCADRVDASLKRAASRRDPVQVAAAKQRAEHRKESKAEQWRRVLSVRQTVGGKSCKHITCVGYFRNRSEVLLPRACCVWFA